MGMCFVRLCILPLVFLLHSGFAEAQTMYTLPYMQGVSPDSAQIIAQSSAYVDAVEGMQTRLAHYVPFAVELLDSDMRAVLIAILCKEDIVTTPVKPYPLPFGDVSVSVTLHMQEDMQVRTSHILLNTLLLIRQQTFFTLLRQHARQAHKLLLVASGIQANTHNIAAENLFQEIARRVRTLQALWLYHSALVHFWDTWKEPSRVEPMLRKAAELAPEVAIFDAALGEVLLQLDRPTEALEHFNAALALMRHTHKPSPQTHPTRKISPIPQAKTHDPLYLISLGMGRVLYMRALGHLRLQQPSIAKADLDIALRIEPQNATWLRARGAVHQVLEEYVAMCEDFAQACSLGDCEGLMLARKKALCVGATPIVNKDNVVQNQENMHLPNTKNEEEHREKSDVEPSPPTKIIP